MAARVAAAKAMTASIAAAAAAPAPGPPQPPTNAEMSFEERVAAAMAGADCLPTAYPVHKLNPVATHSLKAPGFNQPLSL
jgi:hypothetical protein